MKILVHFHFSFLLKIEKNLIYNPFFKILFSFFCKNENEDFSISFFKFSKKWKLKFNEFKEIEILFLSSLFKFEKKIHSVGSRSAIFAVEATHMYNEGSGAGVLGHPPARKARRRVHKVPGPRTPHCLCV